jgi:hypothetical protein
MSCNSSFSSARSALKLSARTLGFLSGSEVAGLGGPLDAIEFSAECASSGLDAREGGDDDSEGEEGSVNEGDFERVLCEETVEDLPREAGGAGEADFGLGVGLGEGRDFDDDPKGHHIELV